MYIEDNIRYFSIYIFYLHFWGIKTILLALQSPENYFFAKIYVRRLSGVLSGDVITTVSYRSIRTNDDTGPPLFREIRGNLCVLFYVRVCVLQTALTDNLTIACARSISVSVNGDTVGETPSSIRDSSASWSSLARFLVSHGNPDDDVKSRHDAEWTANRIICSAVDETHDSIFTPAIDFLCDSKDKNHANLNITIQSQCRQIICVTILIVICEQSWPFPRVLQNETQAIIPQLTIGKRMQDYLAVPCLTSCFAAGPRLSATRYPARI